jgi:heat shock protein beta
VVDAAKQNVDLGDDSEESKATRAADSARLSETLGYLKEVLGAKVDKVELSQRLTSSPSAIVQPQWGMSPQMERFMRAQAVALGKEEEMMGMNGGASTAILEINAKHPVILKLAQMVSRARDAEATADYAQLVYEVAAVTSGYEIAEPAAFARRVTEMMAVDAPAAPEPTAAPEPAASAAGNDGITPVEIVE